MEQEFSDKKTIELWKSRMANDTPIIASDIIGTVYLNEELDITYAFTIDTHGIARIIEGKKTLVIWSERAGSSEHMASMNRIFTKKLIIEVSVSDIESFIEEHLGQTIEIEADLELHDDQDYSIDVKPKISVEERKKLEDWLENGTSVDRMTFIILNHLCLRGFLDKGKYILKNSY